MSHKDFLYNSFFFQGIEDIGNLHKREWDILIILDACRADYFQRQVPFNGKLSFVKQRSSCTIDWLRLHFGEGFYYYTYIAGNPFITKNIKVGGWTGGEHISNIVETWDYGWDMRLKTVPAEPVTKDAIANLRSKRMIVHYMQPHAPFIGAVKVAVRPFTKRGAEIRRKPLTPDEVKRFTKGYIANLDYVLESVGHLFEHIPKHKKVVISSDHAELLGECIRTGHFDNCVCPVLNAVPWFEVDEDELFTIENK